MCLIFKRNFEICGFISKIANNMKNIFSSFAVIFTLKKMQKLNLSTYFFQTACGKLKNYEKLKKFLVKIVFFFYQIAIRFGETFCKIYLKCFFKKI